MWNLSFEKLSRRSRQREDKRILDGSPVVENFKRALKRGIRRSRSHADDPDRRSIALVDSVSRDRAAIRLLRARARARAVLQRREVAGATKAARKLTSTPERSLPVSHEG